ncbi:MAG: alanine--tRNA ligase, partial [Bacteroidota bacterium]
ETFLNFFASKNHQLVKSAPIVVKDDPTLMFINAGMNPFKDIFLGLKNPEFQRVADTQKCLRVSGKHNDLEEVGHDTYHHTMFEMLGNWSFGNYYKQETIDWAWELLTQHYKIDPERLYASVFGGDETDGTEADTEAEKIWLAHLPAERILRYGKKDNFWEMGDVGPCGPCSEIHVDLRSDEERTKIDGASLVNADHPQVVEIWNLVFIQYNCRADGNLEPLPTTHIDTGMGFERLVMALQHKESTYDTDLFDRTRSFLEKKTNLQYSEATEDQKVAIRVIIDHIRAIVFTIADGQIPSNTGAGYVIRRILRRASRYAYSTLGITEPFMYEMVALLAEEYEGVFDEVGKQQAFIERIIKEEESGFLRKLESGSQMFEGYLNDNPKEKVIDGKFAFRLYDTFGFPIDLTELMAREQGREIDMAGFEKELEAQKARSRAATEMDTGDWVEVNPSDDLPRFLGYDTLSLQTTIQKYRTVKTAKKSLYQIVLAETPFYAESGGQVGDKGTISNGAEIVKVLDTKKENQLFVHLVDKLPTDPSGNWTAEVYGSFRKRVMSNHTATHLLHAALRNHLGTHVEQRGSLVSDKSLRFDFSHFSKVTDEELALVEREVNEKIAEGIPLLEHRSMPIDEAKALGAMALFGEKYGDEVRVIVFDPTYSVELCGGTHVSNTQEIRLFKLVSEGSVAAGIRRVEALTSDAALDFYNERIETLDRIGAQFKTTKNLDKQVEDLNEKLRSLEKELAQANAEKVARLKGELLGEVEAMGDIQVIRKQVSVGSADDLKQLAFMLKRETKNTLAVLGTVVKNKPLLGVVLSDDLAETGRFHAGNMVRELAKEIKGGGGGQAFFATAGGKDASGLAAALAKVSEML